VRQRVALSAEPMAKVAGGSDVVRGQRSLPVVLGPSQGLTGTPAWAGLWLIGAGRTGDRPH
jgi:hypothetical protein